MYGGLVVESGAMKTWKLLTPEEYGAAGMPKGSYILQLSTAKETFAVVLTRQTNGEYRATQLAR
jgi:hypothetical protein